MRPRSRSNAFLACLFASAMATLAAGALSARAQSEDGAGAADRTASPRFVITGGTGTESLPLRSTAVDVRVAGVIADVRVRQEYRNDSDGAIEAVYVFPASTRAAVNGLTMTIGTRTIRAEIKEKGAARQTYEQARANGQSASLLEQHRPNVFQMNVANIMPGDVIQVELRYTELLVPTEGVYEFVYPTVVGPRYVSADEAGRAASASWTDVPHQRQGELPRSTLDLAVEIAGGVPLSDVTSPSHRVAVAFAGPADASVRLAPEERHGGTRDFVLRYRLAGARVAPGLLLYQGKDESFFLLTVQPPRRLAAEDMPAREYIFIVDVSGSMHGFPLDVSKTLLRDLVGNLRPVDRFNVLLFAGGSRVLADRSLPATRDNIDRALRAIDGEDGGGGTELLPALERALALPRAAGFSRSVVIATDGFVSVESEAFQLVRRRLGEANVFAFGIGSSVNRHLIDQLARAGQGEAFVVSSAEAAPAVAQRFRRYVGSPVLAGVTVDFNGFAVRDVSPRAIPDLFAERPLVVFGKWTGTPSGEIVVRGRGAQPFEARVPVAGVRPRENNAALRQLWARTRIAELSDTAAEAGGDASDGAAGLAKDEITRLGLAYSLLTEWTSFVAVDSLVRNDGGSTTVQQPLPLPEGVSDLAVQSANFAGSAVAKMSGPTGGRMTLAALPSAPPPPPAPPPPLPSARGRTPLAMPTDAATGSSTRQERPAESKDGSADERDDALRTLTEAEAGKEQGRNQAPAGFISCVAGWLAQNGLSFPAGSSVTLDVRSGSDGLQLALNHARGLDARQRAAFESALRTHGGALRDCLKRVITRPVLVHVTFGPGGTVRDARLI